MAQIHPFSAYRYTSSAGPLDKLVTQPYDKISPSMQARYLALSPYNLVRIILGERLPEDSQAENAYTRAHRHLEAWIEEGVLSRDSEVSVYAYTQEFSSPDGGIILTRKGFIALGDVENYDTRVVHRHEQTLAGPKKDRLELLRHTHAHFGQIFMLYPDPDLAIDRFLDQACTAAPTASVTDEFDTTHRLWRLSNPTLISRIQEIMSDKKLLIADGHHRYETALAFRNENPDLPGARQVMMTLVNMHSPGLRILATHRLVSNLPSFDAAALIERTGARLLDSVASLKDLFNSPAPGRIRIGIALRNGAVYVIDRARAARE
ncbi:MAG: DUF1015 domain-containing protein, partial [Bryobacteraceae bacterium]